MPFHAHRDHDGELVNGLDLLRQLQPACPDLQDTPAFMPISSMGMSSATLMLSRDEEAGGLGEALRARILFMPETELASSKLRPRVADHLRTCATAPASD